jgi:hypothetical protein
METDIGNPIDYNPNMNDENNKIEEEPQQPYYFHPSEMNDPTPPPVQEKTDIFANIEKSTWIIAFAVFLLGFFMGKTMQPVILRYT